MATSTIKMNPYDWKGANAWLNGSENGSGASVVFHTDGHMAHISGRTANISHSEDQLIMTVPAPYKPAVGLNGIGQISGSAVGMAIDTDGKVTIYVMPSGTKTGRLYFDITYPIFFT